MTPERLRIAELLAEAEAAEGRAAEARASAASEHAAAEQARAAAETRVAELEGEIDRVRASAQSGATRRSPSWSASWPTRAPSSKGSASRSAPRGSSSGSSRRASTPAAAAKGVSAIADSEPPRIVPRARGGRSGTPTTFHGPRRWPRRRSSRRARARRPRDDPRGDERRRGGRGPRRSSSARTSRTAPARPRRRGRGAREQAVTVRATAPIDSPDELDVEAEPPRRRMRRFARTRSSTPAALAGRFGVRIIHGRGTDACTKAVRDELAGAAGRVPRVRVGRRRDPRPAGHLRRSARSA